MRAGAPSPNDAPGGFTTMPGKPNPVPEEAGGGKVRLRALRGTRGKKVAKELLARLSGMKGEG